MVRTNKNMTSLNVKQNMLSAKLPIFVLFILVLAISSFGQDINPLEYGSSPLKAVNYNEEFIRESFSGLGISGNQPTVCDLNNDNKLEIIGSAVNKLFVFNLNVTGIEEQARYTWNETILNIACVNDPYDAENRDNIILVIGTDTVKAFNYDAGVLTLAGDTYYTFSSPVAVVSQPHCTEFFDADIGSNSFACAFGADNTDIYKITPPFDATDFNISRPHTTIDNVGYDYLYEWLYYHAGSGQMYGQDTANFSISPIMYTGTIGRSNNIDEIAFYNDVFGGTYFCFSVNWNDNAGSFRTEQNCVLQGTEIIFYQAVLSSGETVYQPVFYDVDIDGDIDICFSSSVASPYKTRCYDLSTQNIVYNSSLVAINMNTIGNIRNIDDPYIMYFDTTLKGLNINNNSLIYDTGIDDNNQFLFIDVNADDRQEIVSSGSNLVVEYSVDPTLTDTITIDSGADYRGFFGFYDPTCTDTTFDIIAKECVDSFASCTYFNDNDDPYVRERLCTTCGGTVPYQCGAWSYTQPKVTCSFATTGTKSIQIDLFTDTNTEYVAEAFPSFSLVVDDSNCDQSAGLINESDGNIGGEEEPPTNGDGETPTDGETPDLTDPETVKAIILAGIAIVITLVVMVSIAKANIQSSFVYLVAVLGCMTFFSIIQWIKIQWALIFIVGVIAIGIVTAMIDRFKGGGS